MEDKITPRTGGPEDVPPAQGWYYVRFKGGKDSYMKLWPRSYLKAAGISKWHGPLAPPEGF